MKLPHSLIAAALTSTLVLSACTGDDDADGTATGSTEDVAGATTDAGSTGDAAGSTGDAAGSTGDAAGSTGDAAGSTAGVDESEESADAIHTSALSIEEADAVAKELLTEAMTSTQLDGKDARKSRNAAFAGAELRAQQAAGRLEAVNGKPDKWNAKKSPIDFQVLAITKAEERGQDLVLVQSVPEEGNPILSLLASQGKSGEFRIIWQAAMLPESSVGTFDRRSTGSAKVGLRVEKGLESSPFQAFTALAEYLSYPIEGENPEMKTHEFGPKVREEARAQAADVSAQAEFSQTHELGDQHVQTIQLADGSALTFAVLDRTSTFDVYDGMELIAPDSFSYFTDDSSITEQATVDTSVFVALHIPKDGRIEVVAAREQVVDAEGN